jgi:trans-2,3-dihydro-3-hydroxyanthranilate isomerase
LQGVEKGKTFARHFGVPPDTLEDPFTGSATGGMAAYLWRHGLIESPTFIAEQGHWMDRPGQASVEVVGPRNDIETVKVGGSAVTVLRGELTI